MPTSCRPSPGPPSPPQPPAVEVSLFSAVWPDPQHRYKIPECMWAYEGDSADDGNRWEVDSDWQRQAWNKLHPWAQIALESTPPLRDDERDQVVKVSMFTDGAGGSPDGSGGLTPSAWAVVITALLADGQRRYLGGLADLTATCEDGQTAAGHAWIGARVDGSLASEMSALFWALRYARCQWPTVDVEVVYDSTAAAGVADGTRAIPAYELLSSVRRAEMRRVCAQAQCQLQHIHSHIGHPWNEAVDGLADYRSRGGPCASAPQWAHIATHLVTVAQQDWEWPRAIPDNSRLEYPKGRHDYRPAPAKGHLDAALSQTDANTDQYEAARTTIRYAIANVCSSRT